VRIIRSRPDGSRETITLTEDVIMTGTDPKGRVQRADVIVVPEKPASAPPHVDVMGAVNKPGRIQMPAGRPMTIVDAISLAGGQSRLADLRKVKVNRASPSNRVLLVDVDAVLKNREPAENVLLEVGDVVFIPERIL
jgi:polysaccharide export outer membrane protein